MIWPFIMARQTMERKKETNIFLWIHSSFALERNRGSYLQVGYIVNVNRNLECVTGSVGAMCIGIASGRPGAHQKLGFYLCICFPSLSAPLSPYQYGSYVTLAKSIKKQIYL